MTNLDISANVKQKTKRDVELTFDELETVSGGFRITNVRGNASTVPASPPQVPQMMAL